MPYKCEDCGRVITDEKFISVRDSDEFSGEDPPCIECGGTFKKITKAQAEKEEVEEDEESEEEEEESEEEEDEDEDNLCSICGRTELTEENSVEWTEENNIGDVFENYETLSICKKCIDKVYPRRIEVKEVVREVIKPVSVDREGKQIPANFIEGKTRFD